jgi:hypothetical protein
VVVAAQALVVPGDELLAIQGDGAFPRRF